MRPVFREDHNLFRDQVQRFVERERGRVRGRFDGQLCQLLAERQLRDEVILAELRYEAGIESGRLVVGPPA